MKTLIVLLVGLLLALATKGVDATGLLALH